MNRRIGTRALAVMAAAALALSSVGSAAAHGPQFHDGEIWITKEAGVDWEGEISAPYGPGDPIGFTIRVGTDYTFWDGSVSDQLPAGFNWGVGWDAPSGADLSCSITGDPMTGQTLDCSFDVLEENDFHVYLWGDPVEFDERQNPVAPPCGTIRNAATVGAWDKYEDDFVTDTDTASLVIEGDCGNPPPPTTSVQIPAIGITKSPSASSVSAGASVTYSYAVTNTSIDALLSGIAVSDDKCAPVTFTGGDADSDGNLQIGETWTYSCTTTLASTTTNVATATGHWRTQTVSATASATVTVGPAPEGGVQGATSQPRITLPPTSVAADADAGSTGLNLGLVLMALAGIAAVLGVLAPMPMRARRRRD